ncbi:thioredoxin family protein [Rhodothermus profundi]|uniref:Peroxiredoxin n=1 Tax=Rhodothermus profundi TaxID=633813 RepID=A0A1M6WQ73_9BACT|nr:thioredoxin family protein [Rhodothermus profundi]SHK95774.1 Peroxiredoxin [Rhodothermus profundi]
MALTYSQEIALGTEAIPFELPVVNPEADGRDKPTRSLEDFAGAQALVILFTCNHCPYAQHIEEALIQVARAYQPRGVQFVAINANDPAQYPEDAPEEMARRAREKGYPFPYLFDETQEVAKAYGARCTPDLYVFDANRRLVYHGRFDDTRPGQGRPATGADLKRVLDELLEHGKVTGPQYPSMGCNIKWKPGNEPH